jgi:hypothetical protein
MANSLANQMRNLLLNCFALFFATSCAFAQVESVRAPIVDERPLDSLTIAFLARAHHSVDTTWSSLSSSILATQLTQALQQQGVDTLLYYRSDCVGCQTLPTTETSSCSCNTAERRTYLYWQHQGQNFVKQLDCCHNHRLVQTTSAAFDFYVQQRYFLEQGVQFDRNLQRHNQTYRTKPRYITVPISQGNSYVHLTTGTHQLTVTVWEGQYDAQGTPLGWGREEAVWRRKQWEWTTRLKQLPIAVEH